MARKPPRSAPKAETTERVPDADPEVLPPHEAPAVEVQFAGKDSPAHLAAREAAVSLRDALSRITSGDRLALARRSLNQTLEIALGKD